MSKVTPKERNLLKGAINRVFARSELHKLAMSQLVIIDHKDPKRTRVKTWYICPMCRLPNAKSDFQVDHVNPKIAIGAKMEDYTWDEYIEDRTWCDINNLRAICKTCHKVKCKEERKQRKEFNKHE